MSQTSNELKTERESLDRLIGTVNALNQQWNRERIELMIAIEKKGVEHNDILVNLNTEIAKRRERISVLEMKESGETASKGGTPRKTATKGRKK